MTQKDKRYHTRYESGAAVGVGGSEEARGTLEDLSISGCKIAFVTKRAKAGQTSCRVTIFPQGDSEIAPFSLDCVPAWTQDTPSGSVAGFTIIKSSDMESFERYVDFLSWFSASRRRID